MGERRWIVAAMVVAGAWAPAGWACLNDTRTSAAEAEFRSRYETVAPPRPKLSPTIFGVDVGGAAATVVAAGVVVSAVVLASRRKGR